MSVTSRRTLATRIAPRLATKGAHAVVLVGSVARGDDHDGSDLDIVAIGAGPAYMLDVVDGCLISIAWKTTAGVRDSFDDPATAGGAVPAWRGAQMLHDPNGIAASLQHAAHGWTWDGIHTQCERIVAAELTGLAEEVHRLVGLRLAGRNRAAAPVRAALTVEVVRAMAIHNRLLYDSENAMWDLVASVMGHDWERDYDIAVGVQRGAADLAALSLYRQAVARADRVLTQQQRTVTDAAIAISDRAV